MIDIICITLVQIFKTSVTGWGGNIAVGPAGEKINPQLFIYALFYAGRILVSVSELFWGNLNT